MKEAEDEIKKGNLSLALGIYQGLLTQRLSSNREGLNWISGLDAKIVERLADLAVPLGQSDAADDMLAALVALYDRAGNRYGADFVSLKRIHLAIESGLLRKAHALLQQMKASIGDVHTIQFSAPTLKDWEEQMAWPETDPSDRAALFCLLYLTIGKLLAALGQYGDASAALERGLFHAERAPCDMRRSVRVSLQLSYSSTLLEKGGLKESRNILASLETDPDGLWIPGYNLNSLELSGKIALLEGEFGSALEMFRRILTVCRERDLIQAELRATLNLAHVMLYLNQTSDARDLLYGAKQRALELGEEDFLQRSSVLLQVMNARSHSLADGVAAAPSVSELWGGMEHPTRVQEDVYEEAMPEIAQSGSYLAFFEDRALSFSWQIGRRDLKAAAKVVEEMEETFATTDSVLIRARMRVLHALLFYYQGDFSRAEKELEVTRSVFSRIGLKPDLWQVQRVLGWCGVRLGRPELTRQMLASDTQLLLRDMTQSLSGSDQAIFLLNKWTADEESLAAGIDSCVETEAAARRSSWFNRMWQRWGLMKCVYALMEQSDFFRMALVEETVDQNGIRAREQKQPPPFWRYLLAQEFNRVNISFLVLPDRVFIVSARKFRLDFGVAPVTRVQIRELVRKWHELAADGGAGRNVTPLASKGKLEKGSKEMAGIVEQLADILQIPLIFRSLPKRIRALTIVPDDSLHGFPFAAMLYEGKRLVERFSMSIGFERIAKKGGSAPDSGKQALLVGVSRGTASMRPLPGARKEIEDLGSWFQTRRIKPRILLDDAASMEVLCNHLPNHSYFHIACHGVFNPDQPDSSGMVLIPSPDQVEILSPRALCRMNLSRLQLVTLSSCWSADNFILPGRWIISLPETFWRAGAHSILGCLWPVHDDVAVPFMKRFYALLAEFPRDRALRITQLECLNNGLLGCPDINTSDPVYWSGFQLYGKPNLIKA